MYYSRYIAIVLIHLCGCVLGESLNVRFDAPVDTYQISLYNIEGERIDSQLYSIIEDEGSYHIDVPEGKWWLTLQTLSSSFDTSHIEAYEIDFNSQKGMDEIRLCVPHENVTINLFVDVERNLNSIWMKLQRFDGARLEPVFRRWVKMDEIYAKEVFYSGTAFKIRCDSKYLVTFYDLTKEHESVQIGAAYASFDDDVLNVRLKVCGGENIKRKGGRVEWR
ncbi:hypothetical protein P4C99_21920 [Pontiellaceae bacterium B1224]|nr:hypothetical protein [Pontiellaceae bacterium B1224]